MRTSPPFAGRSPILLDLASHECVTPAEFSFRDRQTLGGWFLASQNSTPRYLSKKKSQEDQLLQQQPQPQPPLHPNHVIHTITSRETKTTILTSSLQSDLLPLCRSPHPVGKNTRTVQQYQQTSLTQKHNPDTVKKLTASLALPRIVFLIVQIFVRCPQII